MTASILIRGGREKPILNQHPWVFSGAIESVKGSPQPGEIVTVLARDGKFLGRGYWNPKSQIQVRLLTWHDEDINDDWWRARITQAVTSRELYRLDHRAYRLINAENDFLPGLVVDRYEDTESGETWLSLQALTLGIEQRKAELAQMLAEMDMTVTGVYERSDVDVRKLEGLQPTKGALIGIEPPKRITIAENGIRMQVDVRAGHKTGFYLDQAPNRILAGKLAGRGPDSIKRVLNLFSYTGGFSLHALANGADLTVNVDSSREALEMAEENTTLNGYAPERAEFIQANVFELLRDFASEGQQFDLVVLDPPKFAQTAQQVERAARGYKELNLKAFQIVRPGGCLMTFSCSGAVTPDLFQKIVFGALADSGRQAQILRHLGPGEDHPVALTFPEGAYLKGLLLRVY